MTLQRKVTQREEPGSFYRYVTSIETNLPRSEIARYQTQERETARAYRRRYIFNDWMPSIDLHVTFRTTITLRGTNRVTTSAVSVEAETRGTTIPTSAQLATMAAQIMAIHNGWAIPNMSSVFTSMRQILTSIGITSPSLLQKPLDIAWKNLTYAEMVESPNAISLKANGVRFLLCISPVGQFLISSSLDIIPLNIIGSSQAPILIDGELVGNTYYAFDLLQMGGNSYIDRSYDVRHAALSSILPTLSVSTSMSLPIVPTIGDPSHVATPLSTRASSIILTVKPIIIPRSSDEFFKAVERTMDTSIDNDGIIITPLNQSYSESVLKWKPQELLTVDFFIAPNNGKLSLATFENGQMRFHDEIEPILPADIPVNDFIGTISEFAHVAGINVSQTDGEADADDSTITATTFTSEGGRQQWRWVRFRYDKATPNAERVYQAIMRLHQDPITYRVMTGQSLQLMRKYHNRVKRQVYDWLGGQGVKSITDIGSGKGGDLAKWVENGLFVNAIEPDPANVRDFLSRAKGMDATIFDNVQDLGYYQILIGRTLIDLYPIKAESYVNSGATTDALTSFNSATFLGPSTLQDLILDNVNTGGYVVALVIDGKRLEDLYLQDGPYQSPLIEIARVPCPSSSPERIQVGSEQFGNLGCIEIALNDSSTVRNAQVEGLVDVDVLIRTLGSIGWSVETDIFLTEERLLGYEEARYSSAQRLLIFRSRPVGTQVIRRVYRPLPVGQTENVESPWGNLVRTGTTPVITLGGPNVSLIASILQATSPSFRNATPVAKTIQITQAQRNGIDTRVPIYLIPQNSWNMIVQDPADTASFLMYPSLSNVQREPGIVLMLNMGQWEPLAKRDINGNLMYIW